MDKYILQCGEILFSFHLLQRSCRRARCESEAVAEERVIPRDSSATDAYQRSCCLLLVLLVPTNALSYQILFCFFWLTFLGVEIFYWSLSSSPKWEFWKLWQSTFIAGRLLYNPRNSHSSDFHCCLWGVVETCQTFCCLKTQFSW